MDCVFCKIVNKEIPSKSIYEDNEIFGFENIKPEANIHFIFIPKRHIEWKDDFGENDLLILSKIISAAKKVAIEKRTFDACKLIFNVGKTGHIPHIHLHLLGGWGDKVPQNNI